MGEVAEVFADAAYRDAVVDLLGTLSYGELSAFLRLAGDAELAPTLTAKAALSGIAVTEFHHYELLRDRLVRLGADPEAAMAPFIAPIDAFHERTAPRTWLEGLVKYYVGDGIASDFYREVSAFLDPETRDLVLGALADAGQGEFVVAEVRRAIAQEPALAGRLALWGRRLVGEADGVARPLGLAVLGRQRLPKPTDRTCGLWSPISTPQRLPKPTDRTCAGPIST
jgi:hypothetical protein